MNNNSFIDNISLPGEIWKEIPGFDGRYMVSSIGRVASLSFPITAGRLHYSRKPHLLKPTRFANGYYGVNLTYDKNRFKRINVHRLVAEAFLPNPEHLPHINHKDEDKSNNSVDNLEWCTEAYNVNYGTGIERSAKTRIATFCNCKKVAKLNDDGEVIKIYDGLTYAAKDINRDYSAISSSIKRGGKCAGYFWKFV